MNTSPRRLGRYELQQRLAHGGMGDIWIALDTQLQRVVAIKMLRTDIKGDPTFASRFEREAQLIAALHHPNIVQLHDFDFAFNEETQSNVAYMVMDYVQGQTLADYIQNTSRKRQFPSQHELLYLLTGISLALDYAHRQGMIHRDIKPANILLDQRLPTAMPMGEPILTDFGIARLQTAPSGTVIGSILGTPNYISPEQARGKSGDARSDLYSLGVILYELLAGATPFHGDSMISLLMQHINDLPPSPMLLNPQLSPEVSAVILKSIAKEPENRYPTASAMTIALAQAFGMAVPNRLLAPSQKLSAPGFPTISPAPGVTSTPTAQEQWRSISAPALHTHPTGQQIEQKQYRGPVTPVTPTGEISSLPTHIPVSVPSQTLSKKQRTQLYVLFLVATLIVILGSLLTAWFTKFQRTTTPTPPATVGQILFTHSATALTGSYDTLQITINHLPAPPANYTYYAWISPTNSEGYYPHWQLPTQGGTLHITGLTYPSYNHGNLLAESGLFLITQELTTGPAPIIPNLNSGGRLYYAHMSPSSTSLTLSACPAGNACYTG